MTSSIAGPGVSPASKQEVRRREKCRILVLDGQSNPALASVRSLGRAGHTVYVASPVRQPLGAWSRHCSGRYRHEGYSIAAFAALRAWAYNQGVTVVLPMSEESCSLCNMERDAWESLGMTIGCGPDDMLKYAFDKGLTLQAAESSGLRIPPTRFPQSLEECRAAAAEVGYPCVVKPRFSQIWDGNGFRPSSGVAFAATPTALDAAVLKRSHNGSWPLIQGFVPGRGTGVFALYDRGQPVAWFAQESLRSVRPMASPNCLRRAVAVQPRLRAQAELLLGRFQWHGPAMVELRDDGQTEPWLMEVNGRFWVSLQLAIAAGVDFPVLWVNVLTGQQVNVPPSYDEGVVLRWLWGDVKRFVGIALTGPPPGYPAPYPTVWEGLRDLLGPQPARTQLEMWQRDDPLPAVGEWIQGVRQTMNFLGRREGVWSR